MAESNHQAALPNGREWCGRRCAHAGSAAHGSVPDAGLDVQSLVDGPMRYLYLQTVGVVASRAAGDLLYVLLQCRRRLDRAPPAAAGTPRLSPPRPCPSPPGPLMSPARALAATARQFLAIPR